MDTEFQKQRRNLLGVSLGLVVFEFSGGKAESISFLGGGIKLTDGQAIITLAYISLAYLLWRYWLYARPLHEKFQNEVKERINNSTSYRGLITPLVENFKNEAGVAYKDGWNAYHGIETKEKYIPIPVNTLIEKNLFSRKLLISVENSQGEFHPEKEIHNISYAKYELITLKAWLSSMMGDKSFSDLYVPYTLSFLAIASAVFREFYA
ncbi:hypothetical protein [Noviherbaspirillum sedimenti]|uniref:Uncharacterized protein n=1 Tax=Noviherbaspirillum sedimenti TaxID=2320865 RepID=A0A3A3G2Q9_9BURK|nr:hypothetical protein [Noviherbaspirillum sedimenti]RJG02778.1 hypothetical protein D3878_15310 [Noviherbaspirillum sedimenti]